MEAAYIGVKLWAEAVEQAGTDGRRRRFAQAMLGQKLLAPEGEVRIDPATRHAFKTPRIGQIDADGQFEVVWKAVKPEAPEFRFRRRAPKSSGRNSLPISTHGWGNHWCARREK